MHVILAYLGSSYTSACTRVYSATPRKAGNVDVRRETASEHK